MHIRKTHAADHNLVEQCGLAGEADGPRITLMLELVCRVGLEHERLSRGEAAPTATEKREELKAAIKLIEELASKHEELKKITSTWLEGGPLGSPDIARWSLARRVAANFAFPYPPFHYLRVWSRRGRRVTARSADNEDELQDSPPDGMPAETRTTWTDPLPMAMDDLAFACDEFVPNMLRAVGFAAKCTLVEVRREGRTRKSEEARDTVMRDLALVYHAVHRIESGYGTKTPRARFVQRALARFGAAMDEESVANRLRKPCFRLTPNGPLEPFGDVPPPYEFDATAMLRALERKPGDHTRRLELEPLIRILGPAAGILLVDGGALFVDDIPRG